MRIAILAYDGISPFMMSTPLAVFGESYLASGHTVEICAAGQRFTAEGALTIAAPHPLEQAGSADLVILPGWRSVDAPIPDAILTQLKAAHDRGAIVAGLCLGAFGLAEAGLLDGRRATTHWARAADFAVRFPRVQLDPGALFVDEGAVLTSAGVASGLDCCLHLLGRLSGVREANRVARHLVVAPVRGGEQPQIIDSPAIRSPLDLRIAGLLEAVRADPQEGLSLDLLARRAGVSRRTLTRHIRTRTGGSLGDWLRRARLARAQEMLASGARGLGEIAAGAGFPDAHALRAAFRAELGLTPTQWLARQRLT